MKFIKNRYYKIYWEGYNNTLWYFRFNEESNKIIYICGYMINNYGDYNEGFYFFDSDEYIYTEVQLDEFVEYLPDKNQDKIIYMRKKKISKLLSM